MKERYEMIFDPDRTLRYYYSKLGDKKKNIYRLMHDAIESMDPSITISGPAAFNLSDLCEIQQLIKKDNPKLFWISNELQVVTGSDSTTVHFKYIYNEPEVKDLKKRLDYSLESLVSKISQNDSSEYDLELAVHDLMSERIQYDVSDDDSHCIVGPMLHKKGVCEGIALALKYVLDSIGIKCITVEGDLINGNGEGHLWNIVKINDESYHLDVTNDLKLKCGYTSHRYFNVPDTMLNNTHRWSSDIRCDSMADNYYQRNGLNFRTLKEAESYLKSNKSERMTEIRIQGHHNSKSVISMVSRMNIGATVHYDVGSDVYLIEINKNSNGIQKIIKLFK